MFAIQFSCSAASHHTLNILQPIPTSPLLVVPPKVKAIVSNGRHLHCIPIAACKHRAALRHFVIKSGSGQYFLYSLSPPDNCLVISEDTSMVVAIQFRQ